VVIGIGLNLALSEEDAADIGQPWAALKNIRPDLSRNQVAGVLLNELLLAVDEFQKNGFAPYQEYWSGRDVFHNKEVQIIGVADEKRGVVKGVNRKGELLLHTDKGMEVITAGEISVRPV